MQDNSTTDTQPDRLETREVAIESKMTSRIDNQASYNYDITNVADDEYADMPPLITADGAIVVEQDDTSTPRATLDITAGIDFPKAPEWYLIDMRASNARSRSIGTLDVKPEVKHLNGKSLAELNTSNFKVNVEELSDLSVDEKLLTPAASECDAASMVDTNAEAIIDARILDGVGVIDEGITKENSVARQTLPKRVRFKKSERKVDEVKEKKAGNGVQSGKYDAHMKAMAHKYASSRAFMDKVHGKAESLQSLHKEKAKAEALHDKANDSMYKQIEKVEQKREGLYKKPNEVRAKHDKVVEESARWMAKHKEREKAVDRKIQVEGKEKIDLQGLSSEQ